MALPYTDYSRKARSAAPSSGPRAVRRPASSFGYRGWDDHRLITPLLAQFIILSILLHILGILLFGAPSGGSRQGRAMWGSLEVILADSYRERGPALKIDPGLALPAPAARSGRPPRAPAPRTTPAPPKAPPPAAAKAPPPAPEAAIVSTPAEAPVVVPKLLDRIPTPRPSVEMEPAFEVPPPTPAPIETGAPLAPLAAPRVERQLAAPPVLDAPLVPPAPTLAPLVTPRIERQLAAPPTLDAPLVQPAPDLAPLVTPRIERELAQPPAIAAPAEEPLPAPPPQAAPAQPLPPPAVQEAPAAPKVEPAAPVRPVSPEAMPAPSTEIRKGPAATDRGAPAAPSAPKGQIETPFRAPGPPAPAYDPTAAPKLDLDALGKRAGELAREGTGNRAVLPFPMPPVPPKKSKMEQAIENARKPDCRDAYKSLGLAAVVPLIANEFGEGTCRW